MGFVSAEDFRASILGRIMFQITDDNIRLVSVIAPFTPKYHNSDSPHNTTLKSGESAYLVFIPAEGKKTSMFMLVKKRTKGYFVFDFLASDTATIGLFKFESMFGMTKKSEFEDFVNEILNDYHSSEKRDFDLKYIK
jgi:hypothetical protein